jgi:hypothetical protein
MTKKLILGIFRSWDVLFITIIICMFLIQRQFFFNILQNIWYNNFLKKCGLWLCNKFKNFKEEVNALVRGPFERQII